MQITLEELERRLKNPGNLSLKLAPETKKKGNDESNRNNAGRKPEVPNAPKSLRVVAGVCAKIDNGNVAAKELELTPGQVRYAAGKEKVKLTEKKVQEIALTRLMDAFGLLTPESMQNEKPKDLSIIAANLSRVHSNLREKDSNLGNNVSITIYSPKQKDLSDYDVIEVQSA